MKLEGIGGPFCFCDYWASVLKLTNIVSERLVSAGHVSMDLYRKGLDRPKTKVPKLRYYFLAFMLGPGMIPYKLAFSLAWLFKPKSQKRLLPKLDRMLEHYRLDLEPDPEDSHRVRVSTRGKTVAEKVLNPAHVSVTSDLFFPTYKVLVAAIMAILVTSVAIPHLSDLHPIFVRYPDLSLLLYPLLFLGLYLLFRDLWTAFLAPLPVFVARWLFSISGGVPAFLLAMACVALLFYMVEFFFIPRSIPPALFLYVNDPGHELYPYRGGHEPYWLEGRLYWVWRFVVLAPAEITKFWEKDWERLEVWIRADSGESAGKIEWLVTDCHYRELWFRYESETTPGGRREHERLLERSMAPEGRPLAWVIEYDLDFLFHTPDVRGVFAATQENGRIGGAAARILRALGKRPERDRFGDYRDLLEDMEADGNEFLEDVPEHFRQFLLRRLIRLPWTYWRYPKGAVTSTKVPTYNPTAVLAMGEEKASEPQYQIKSFKQQGVHT